MGMLAFIVNIGLFVKAKINLQNSVDAAAYAGAAVQARQLSNIAYLNWEMRNNYKEWMFKYYVLGQLGSLRVSPDPSGPFPLARSLAASENQVDFTLKTLKPVAGLNIGGGFEANGGLAFDHYNMPSICVHNSTATDICPQYIIPGLPRFPAIGVAGISEVHEAAVSELVSIKALNCSVRSKENFTAALSWAYGAGMANVPPTIPALYAADRPGAWPRSIEMAMRMRNLEMIVNLPPHDGPITYANARTLPTEAGNTFALNERPYKAFISAYKNLSGGKYKENGEDELSAQFKLYELAPEPYITTKDTLSGFLIPSDASFPGTSGKLVLHKQYLDLQAMPLNLATMFTTFTTATNELGGGIRSEGTCAISKTAMPVPGFILGFVKNPQVMTYYAVKGESKFIGLFSPFRGTTNQEGVTLTAYAAAKPFGGRVGPKLFSFTGNNTTVAVRKSDSGSRRSLPYVYGLKIGFADRTFKPGAPIPVSSNFWINSFDQQATLGGVPSIAGQHIYFGIPNLIYDYTSNINRHTQTTVVSSTDTVADILPKNLITDQSKENLGLYDPEQYKLLKNSLAPEVINGSSYTSSLILDGIVKARRATRYDAVNYLIPDYMHVGSTLQSSPPVVTQSEPPPVGTHNVMRYQIFAPLVGENLLYKTLEEIQNIVGEYITTMAPAVEVYEKSLLEVAQNIYALRTTGLSDTTSSAETIHAKVTTGDWRPELLNEANCKTDIASKFWYFFQTQTTVKQCGVEPLQSMMTKFVDDQRQGDKQYFFNTEYFTGNETEGAIDQNLLLTGYFPGPRQGVANSSSGNNLMGSPLGLSNNTVYNSRRNYYSTKFFRLAMVIQGSAGMINEPTLREELLQSPIIEEDIPKPILNLIKKEDVPGDYFLDF